MKKLLLLLLLPICSFAQELSAPDYIRTIEFRGSDDPLMQLPIVSLGSPFTLSFDDLRGQEADYYYTLTHCDYDWQPSGLLKSEYLKGMDDVRITQYRNSYGTLQPYTHYDLTLPNNETDFLITGNYLLTVTDSEQRPIFTRRFVLYTRTALCISMIEKHPSREETNICILRTEICALLPPESMLPAVRGTTISVNSLPKCREQAFPTPTTPI